MSPSSSQIARSQLLFTLFSISLLTSTSHALPASSAEESATVTSAPTSAASGSSVDWQTVVTWPAGCETWANPCPSGAKTSGAAPSSTVVTWPAGCETWANPCPSTAVVSAGTSATAESAVSSATAESWSSASDYTNGFTSFTTQTNSEGVITGMPSKATVAPGASSVLSEQSSWLASVAAESTALATSVTESVTSDSNTATATASGTSASITTGSDTTSDPTSTESSFASSSATGTSSASQGSAVTNGVSAMAVMVLAGLTALISL